MAKKRMTFPVRQGKSSFKRAVLEHLGEQQKEVIGIKRDLHKLVDGAVDKAFESKLPVIEGRIALKEANIVKRLLIQKGIISEEEFLEEFKKTK